MPTTDLDAASEPPRPELSWDRRWLTATAWLHSVLLRRLPGEGNARAGGELAELLPWEDRELLLTVLLVASAGDRAELADWLAEALGHVTRQPVARFGPLAEEAESWAAMASEAEVKAWLLACVARLPAAERVKFVAAVQRQAVAGVTA